MIEHELLFLGLLAEGPKHGYEIKRQIEEDLLPNVGLKIKSIYYPLKKIEEAGLIEKETGRQGNWPEKYVYRITSKGKKKFNELIEASFISIERPFFEMDLSLYFLPLVDRSMAKRRLKVRLALLKKLARELSVLKEKSLQKSKSSHLILQHGLDLVEAEIASTNKLVQGL
jgi:DNA-binding PadR family transcriptional regulator